jgi:hypothetical protein
MLRVYWSSFYDRAADRHRPSLREELAYAAQRLEEKHRWPGGTLDHLARLTLAVHDLGKLDEHWQAWAHTWQTEVSQLRGQDLAIPDEYLAAHTDYDEQNKAEMTRNRKLSRTKPNHAAESAAAVADWMLEQAGDQSLARAVLTAIVRHHSAGASGGHGSFRAHPAATDGLTEALNEAGAGPGDLSSIRWTLAEGELGRRLIRPRRERELLPYLLLARVLRLADQRSQELTRSSGKE